MEPGDGADVQIVRCTWRKGALLTAGSFQRFPQEDWSSTDSSGEVNDCENREHVVLNLFSNIKM